jgi:hypothetical protein
MGVAQLDLVFAPRNLSARHGGQAGDVRTTYCRWFRYRPQVLDDWVLCSGGKWWRPCPDLDRCRKNKPRKPAPVAQLRQEDCEEDNGCTNDASG